METKKEVITNDTFTILNYQGSKKKLLNFIHSSLDKYIDTNSTILDIFSGTCAVGYSYKRKIRVYANDAEYYSYLISNALLLNNSRINKRGIIETIEQIFQDNYNKLLIDYEHYIKTESLYMKQNFSDKLYDLYKNIPTIWNGKIKNERCSVFSLFTKYYAGNYFGIEQAIEIDCLRKAIEYFKNDSVIFSILLSALFYAMKECVFAKDGHMAQPLDPQKNISKFIKSKKQSIKDNFNEKLNEFFSPTFVQSKYENKVYNLTLEKLLQLKEIQNNTSIIYADPPYTDMQYSRYYHLLNIVAKYNYPNPTMINNQFTKGLYTDGRYQSSLSCKSSCLDDFSKLISYAKENNKILAISFGYPKNPLTQKTDRYVMNIDDLIARCRNIYGYKNVEVSTTDYLHSNNRNEQAKNVLEYMIICKF